MKGKLLIRTTFRQASNPGPVITGPESSSGIKCAIEVLMGDHSDLEDPGKYSHSIQVILTYESLAEKRPTCRPRLTEPQVPKVPEHPPILYSTHEISEIIRCQISADGTPFLKSTKPTGDEVTIGLAAMWEEDHYQEREIVDGGGYLGSGAFKMAIAVRIQCIQFGEYLG